MQSAATRRVPSRARVKKAILAMALTVFLFVNHRVSTVNVLQQISASATVDTKACRAKKI